METWEDWQQVYRQGTFVIWPPAEVREIVNRQRQEYDPVSAGYCQAHITLTQPLLEPLSEAGWQEIRQAAASFQPFEIRFGPLRSFLPYPCIWYEIQPVDRILALRKALHGTGLFNLSLAHSEGFIPHMTITEGLSGPEVNTALLQAIQEESGSGSFTCCDISYIAPDRDFRFRVLKGIPLGESI